MSVIRPVLLPDEFAPGYLGRVLQFNGWNLRDRVGGIAFLRSTMNATPGSSLAEVLASVAGLSFAAFMRLHTTVPLRRAIVAKPSRLSHADDPDAGDAIRRGLSSLRSGAYLCSACVEEDLRFHGMSYWRREHQLPGLYWCLKHHLPLRFSGDSKAFLYAPSAALASAMACGEAWVGRLSTQEAIARFITIESNLSSSDHPLSEKEVARALHPLLHAAGLHVGRGVVRRPLLSDLFKKTFDVQWLQQVFAGLVEQPRGAFWQPVDGASLGKRAFVGSGIYLAAFALLVDDADEATNKLLSTQSALTEAVAAQGKPAARPTDNVLRDLYASCQGDYARVAGRVDESYSSKVNRRLQALGLPCLRKQHPPDVRRLLALVASGEVTLNAAADMAGIPRIYARSIVQNSFTPAQRALVTFEDQRRMRKSRGPANAKAPIVAAPVEDDGPTCEPPELALQDRALR